MEEDDREEQTPTGTKDQQAQRQALDRVGTTLEEKEVDYQTAQKVSIPSEILLR
jgi:hypothetical protein